MKCSFDDFCVLFVKLKCIVWVLMMLSLIAIWWCYLWCWNFENLEGNWKMNVLITFGKSIKNLSKCEVTWLKCEETKANAVSQGSKKHNHITVAWASAWILKKGCMCVVSFWWYGSSSEIIIQLPWQKTYFSLHCKRNFYEI